MYPEPTGYQGAGAVEMSKQAMIVGKLHSPTLAENIDNRIASMEEQIKRLTRVRSLLAEGRILDVPIEDLRFAMNY